MYSKRRRGMSGVYKITNIITGEFYIGSSVNIRMRWLDHIKRYDNPNNKEYNKPLYIAFRKYGINNFKFTILEYCNEDVRLSKEAYYISDLNAEIRGYNQNKKGDNHGKSKLTIDDVIDIRTRYRNLEKISDVYKLYKKKIGESGFHKIWNGYTWKHIMMNVYTLENKKYHKSLELSFPAQSNPNSKITNYDVIIIRNLKKHGSNPKDIYYSRFADKLKFKSFMNIWYECNWKSIK